MTTLDPAFVLAITKKALREWGKNTRLSDSAFCDFQLLKNKSEELSQSAARTSPQNLTGLVLQDGIKELSTQDEIGAEILEMRFSRGETLTKVAFDSNLSSDQVSRRQRIAIESLSNILFTLEMELRKKRLQSIEKRLPAKTYSKMFGHRKIISRILKQISNPEILGALAIIGLGGIGKSTLADYFIRKAISQNYFEDAIWVRAPNYRIKDSEISAMLTLEAITLEIAKYLLDEKIPPTNYPSEIKNALKNKPSIIVIDNLDFKFDNDRFLSSLLEYASPSIFVLTSRIRLPGTSDIYSVEVNELSYTESRSLMIHQAKMIGLENIASDIKSKSRLIYSAIGGNPLALKVTIGLLEILPLREVLHDLTKTRIERIEDLYRGVFLQSWMTLSTEARKLLGIMPLVGEAGGTLKHLNAISRLPDNLLLRSIQELANRCLIEKRGSIDSTRYGIHKLTDAFLRSEIIKT
jgi:hypothetical protein